MDMYNDTKKHQNSKVLSLSIEQSKGDSSYEMTKSVQVCTVQTLSLPIISLGIATYSQ